MQEWQTLLQWQRENKIGDATMTDKINQIKTNAAGETLRNNLTKATTQLAHQEINNLISEIKIMFGAGKANQLQDMEQQIKLRLTQYGLADDEAGQIAGKVAAAILGIFSLGGKIQQ